jgi:hypothetical protein
MNVLRPIIDFIGLAVVLIALWQGLSYLARTFRDTKNYRAKKGNTLIGYDPASGRQWAYTALARRLIGRG